MAIEVKVPDIGDFKDVPIIEVHVQPGARVKAEDPLITLESDKATMDVPAPQAGTVAEVKVAVGDRVGEGALILLLEPEGAAAIPPKEKVKEGAAPGSGGPAATAPRRRLRDDRGQGSRHRRLQGRAGHRGPRRRGCPVKAEDPLLTLESDKATMEVPAPQPARSRGSRSRSATGWARAR